MARMAADHRHQHERVVVQPQVHDHDDHHHDHADDDDADGLLPRVKHVLIPQSHDTADQVDSALEGSREGLRCLAWSFAILAATALLQVVVVVLSGSARCYASRPPSRWSSAVG